MAKEIKLRPSFPERYESATETELDEAEQPECIIPAYDSDVSEEGRTQMSEFLKTGRTVLTEENFRDVAVNSMRQVYVAPIMMKPGKEFYAVKSQMFTESTQRSSISAAPQVEEQFYLH
jgi:hypothetical protein